MQVKVPNAPYMFSDLNHFPRAHLEIKRDDPVPSGITRDFGTKRGLLQCQNSVGLRGV